MYKGVYVNTYSYFLHKLLHFFIYRALLFFSHLKVTDWLVVAGTSGACLAHPPCP